MGIYWELGDVQTTPEKVSARWSGLWNVRDVKLKFKNKYFRGDPTCFCVEFCTIRRAKSFYFYLYFTLANWPSKLAPHTTEPQNGKRSHRTRRVARCYLALNSYNSHHAANKNHDQIDVKQHPPPPAPHQRWPNIDPWIIDQWTYWPSPQDLCLLITLPIVAWP